MADLMQQARELLAAEYRTSGHIALADMLDSGNGRALLVFRCELRAIAAALRAAPAGFVLVQAKSVVPCDCGCHRHCCRHCGADLGGFAARPQGVKHGR